MAEKDAVESTASSSLVAKVWNAITRDGTLAAAGRQGADEFAQALKAFPDSIGVDEVGTILNPTQGEIAADRRVMPSPSEIARDKTPYRLDQDQDQDLGHGR